MDYNSINFKNKDVDKFANRFGNGDPIKNASEKPMNQDPILQTSENIKKRNAEKIKAGIDSVVKQTPAEARAFDAKRKKQEANAGIKRDALLAVEGVGNAVIKGAKATAQGFNQMASDASKKMDSANKSLQSGAESMRKKLGIK